MENFLASMKRIGIILFAGLFLTMVSQVNSTAQQYCHSPELVGVGGYDVTAYHINRSKATKNIRLSSMVLNTISPQKRIKQSSNKTLKNICRNLEGGAL